MTFNEASFDREYKLLYHYYVNNNANFLNCWKPQGNQQLSPQGKVQRLSLNGVLIGSEKHLIEMMI